MKSNSINKNSENLISVKSKQLSEYIKLNLFSFQCLKEKNYQLASYTFEKCIELSKDIDELKYIESLTNYSITLFFSGNIEESYSHLIKAKELSTNIYELATEFNQIHFLHLRILSNLSLISLSMNNIIESKELFNKCISLINDSKIKNIHIKLSMLHELVYIFFRLDSLTKYHEINSKNNFNTNINIKKSPSINNVIQINNNKCLYNLHKSLKNNDIKYWLDCLNKEIKANKNTEDGSGFIFLIINQMAASFCYEGEVNKENINNCLEILVQYYQETYGKEIKIKEDDINKLLDDFKLRFDTAVEYYQILIHLEQEIIITNSKQEKEKIISANNTNKILFKLLLNHALNNLEITNNKENNEIKKQIEQTLKLIQSNNINWSVIPVMQMNNNNSELIKSLKILFNNLVIIRKKILLTDCFNKFKYSSLGYIDYKSQLKKKYLKSEKFLKNQLEELEDGAIILKFNFNSKGTIEHFYKISKIKNSYKLLIFSSIKEIEPYKEYSLSDLQDITIGIKTENLVRRLNPNIIKEFKPWNFLSLWFADRTIDLYFDSDEEINKWFEGIFYYNWKILKKNKIRKDLNYLFIAKLKLKLLYKVKNMKYNLPIIKQLKTFEEQNEIEYQALPFIKTVLLYSKVCEKLSNNNNH